MIEELARYRAICDTCFRFYSGQAPSKWLLRQSLRSDGWRVSPCDNVTCPDCLTKEVKNDTTQ